MSYEARHLATTAKIDLKRYLHDDIGYNYRLVNILSALGLAQLENLDKFIAAKDIYSYYTKNIFDLAQPIFRNLTRRANQIAGFQQWFLKIASC